MIRGIWAVVDMAFRLFLRDKHSLFWGIAFPIIMMGLIGSVFAGSTSLLLQTSVISQSDDMLNEGLISALREVPTLRVIEEDEATALQALRRGDRSLVIILPEASEGSVEGALVSPVSEVPLTVQLYYDDLNYEVAQAGIAIVNQIVGEFNRIIVPRVDVLQVEASGISAEQLSMMDFLLPGILAMVLMQSGLMGVTAVITSYRERLLLKRVLSTPFPPLAFLSGLVARFMVTNLLQGGIVLLVGVLVFGAKVIGNYGNLLLLSIVGSITFTCMGFAISTMSKTPDGANTFGSAVAFPMMFLSGTFWPREFVPEALQPVIDALPLTPLVESLRAVATQGDSLANHTGGMLYMGAWAIVSLIVAARRFKWE